MGGARISRGGVRGGFPRGLREAHEQKWETSATDKFRLYFLEKTESH